MRHQLNDVNLNNPEQWLVQRRSFNNITDAVDKVVFTGQAIPYIQSRLYNIQCRQEKPKCMKTWAERHSEEINSYKELLKLDRSRAVALQKKLDERTGLARSQFKKTSFRVSRNMSY